MKVWLGYQCCYNGCDTWRTVTKVFDDEVKALIWKEDFNETDYDYREYEEMKVE
jgi:hypothetical protein